jgi:Arc/MetJ family transcription regulator
VKKIRTKVPVTPAMNEIDLRTDLETVDAQLKRAQGGDEIRRLNARKQVLQKKLLKANRRATRSNDGIHPSHKRSQEENR